MSPTLSRWLPDTAQARRFWIGASGLSVQGAAAGKWIWSSPEPSGDSSSSGRAGHLPPRSTSTRCSPRYTFLGRRRSRRRWFLRRTWQLRPDGAQQADAWRQRIAIVGDHSVQKAEERRSFLVRSSCISRSRSDCVWRRQLRCLRGRRQRAEQEPACNPGREHQEPRRDPDHDDGNGAPSCH